MRATSAFAAALALASGAAAGKMRYLGVAIPGIDFGCDIDGSCPTDTSSVPLLSYKGGDGAGQMKHFAEDDGLNVFRICECLISHINIISFRVMSLILISIVASRHMAIRHQQHRRRQAG